jgi:catechol 2,3-dioxygenase-like lactoylglutathione lyase family enzyme
VKSVDETVADIGHVHLKVADLDRAASFYRDLLGMEIKNAVDGAVFLAFGRYHHHLASTRGKARTAIRPLHRPQACTTSPSATPLGTTSRRPSSAFSTPASLSSRHPTAAGSPTRSTFAIRIRMASS